MKTFFDRLIQRVIARHRLVLLTAAALFAAAIVVSLRLELDPDILNLVPRQNREVNEFRQVLEGLGTIDQHLIVVELPSGSDPAAYTPLIASLAERFRAMPEIASVDAEIPDVLDVAREMLPYALLYFTPAELPAIEARLTDAAIRDSVAQNAALLQTPQSSVAKGLVQWDPFRLAPLLLEKARPGGSGSLKIDTSTGYLLSSDRTTFLVNVKPKRSAQDIPFARTLLERSRGAADSALAAFERENRGVTPPAIGFAGGYAVTVSDAALIRKDVTINVVSSLVLILLLFLYAFRSLASIAYAAVPMLFSIALTFGVAALALGRLSSASAVFGALVAGLGIDFVTITYERYLDHRNRGEAVNAALRAAYVATMPGVVVAAVTTAGTFYAYLLTDYRGMSELGLLVGTGVLLFGLAVAILVPAVIVAVDGRSVHRHIELRSFGASRLISAAMRRPGLTIALWAIAIVVAAVGARGVRFDPEISSFRSKDNPAAALQDRVSRRFGQGFSAMLYVEEKATLDAAVDATARQRPELDRLARQGAIGSYQSIGTVLPPLSQQTQMIALAETRSATTLDFDRIERTFREALEANGFRASAYDDYLQTFRALLRPAKPLDYATLQETSLAPLLERFVRRRGDRWMSVTYLYPKERAWPTEVPAPILQWRERAGGVVTGVNLVSMTLRRIIQRDAVRSTVWGLVAVFILFAVFQRSVPRALLMFVPLLAGCTIMVGLMSASGLRFNLVNAFVGLMLVGVATDYAIYIVQGHREDPATFALRAPDTAKAVAMAALTSMVGFGSFITSHFPGMRSIGYTSLLGIGFSCLAAITLLPAILELRGERGRAIERGDPASGKTV